MQHFIISNELLMTHFTTNWSLQGARTARLKTAAPVSPLKGTGRVCACKGPRSALPSQEPRVTRERR